MNDYDRARLLGLSCSAWHHDGKVGPCPCCGAEVAALRARLAEAEARSKAIEENAKARLHDLAGIHLAAEDKLRARAETAEAELARRGVGEGGRAD